MSLTAAPAAAQPAQSARAPAPAAPEADAPKLAIAPIAISGADDPLLASQLEQDLRGGLARGRLQLLDAEAVARVAGGACSDDACLERLRDQLGAAFVLRAQVTVSDRDYTLRLELVATRDLGRAAESERGCELCGLAELRALTADQAARLLAKLDALAKPPPAFEIATTPPGALVFIDGQLVGAAPVERNVLEGKHVVRVMSEGYVPEERELVAVAGLRESLQIDLRRTPEALKLRGTGWGLLFTGIPLFAIGLGLLSLDGDEYRGRCDGPERRPRGPLPLRVRHRLGRRRGDGRGRPARHRRHDAAPAHPRPRQDPPARASRSHLHRPQRRILSDRE
ncbi:PEGA domain-containing protein [Nannocystis pusilla]|uniref:PEGA domain-containing protein n=1 Tax=Nannocystis pusilla TaxID=889268 RepID=UPI003DA58B65